MHRAALGTRRRVCGRPCATHARGAADGLAATARTSLLRCPTRRWPNVGSLNEVSRWICEATMFPTVDNN
eukprot:194100-Prymnesium_polylepis.1